MADEVQGPDLQVVVFRVADEHYAVEIARIREVVPAEQYRITPVPRTPAYLRGVTNLRGRVIPVMDLRLWLGLTARALEPDTRIAVAETAAGMVGMVVDGVSEVVRLAAADVESPAQALVDPALDAARGVARVRGRVVTLLDLDRILSDARPARHEGGRYAAGV